MKYRTSDESCLTGQMAFDANHFVPFHHALAAGKGTDLERTGLDSDCKVGDEGVSVSPERAEMTGNQRDAKFMSMPVPHRDAVAGQVGRRRTRPTVPRRPA
ncbi:MAG TPA: hypothetical protein VD994_02170 [Prosthecobacter sp.]|nr:hypothetical protein [Prosthecobacter sp.]